MGSEVLKLVSESPFRHDWIPVTHAETGLLEEGGSCRLGDPAPTVIRFNLDRNVPDLKSIVDSPLDRVHSQIEDLHGGVEFDSLAFAVDVLFESEIGTDLNAVAVDLLSLVDVGAPNRVVAGVGN